MRLTLQGGDSSPVSALRRAPLVVVIASAITPHESLPLGEGGSRRLTDEGNATNLVEANSEEIKTGLEKDLPPKRCGRFRYPSPHPPPSEAPSPRGRLLDEAAIVNPPMERAEARW